MGGVGGAGPRLADSARPRPALQLRRVLAHGHSEPLHHAGADAVHVGGARQVLQDVTAGC